MFRHPPYTASVSFVPILIATHMFSLSLAAVAETKTSPGLGSGAIVTTAKSNTATAGKAHVLKPHGQPKHRHRIQFAP